MTNLPRPLQDEGQLVALYDELMAIAAHHEGLLQAVHIILSHLGDPGTPAEMLAAMQPLAKQLRKIAELDRWLGQVPSNLSEEEIHRKLKARRMGERDTAINDLLALAKALDKAPATEAVPERNRRYYEQMMELVGQGSTTRQAAHAVYLQESTAGRHTPAEDTIRKIYHDAKK
jgi:hypothetical protein